MLAFRRLRLCLLGTSCAALRQVLVMSGGKVLKALKIIKRISIIFFCSLLIFVVVLTSTSYKTKAVVPALAAGAAALIAFLTASGIALSANNIANNQTMSDTLNDLANQYSEDSGAPTLEETIAAQDALNYYYNDKAGEALVSMSNTVTDWMSGFKDWFVQNFGLTTSVETTVVSKTSIALQSGDYPFYMQGYGVFDSTNKPLSSVPVVPDTVQEVIFDSNRTETITFGQVYTAGGYWWFNIAVSYNNNGSVSSFSHNYLMFNSSDYTNMRVIFTSSNSTASGSFQTLLLPTDAGSYASGYGFTAPWGLSGFDVNSIGLSGSLTDGYQDFQDALDGAKADAGENGQIAIDVGDIPIDKPYTEEGVVEGILDNAITNVGTGTLVGGYADEKEVEEETDSEKVPTYAEIGKNIVVVDGLEDFFPFCIPFDLIAMIQKFDVEPEAPVIHWNMNFANVFNSEEVVLDFSAWETAALIFRICCLIGFSIFLILKTRDLIRG